MVVKELDSLALGGDLNNGPPRGKKINFLSITEQNLLFILSCVPTM